ncbi:hypothetical protein XM52_28975 [Roseovarius indicus]|uniref:Uncharacterized protein n=1 Tax=Roseovarius indicus TaxID=540747 RepID=A0A0T5NP26_9RHOB|nr:hypothetical protein XM52_28975 [Roseovarius indicus]
MAFFCPYKHRTDGSIGLLHAEHFRFERARPLLCIAMFRVVFVGQRVEKLFVRVGSSTVLWRAGSLSGNTGGKVQIWTSGRFANLLNGDEMPPAISKIISVCELTAFLDQLSKSKLLFVLPAIVWVPAVVTFVAGLEPVFANLELMQMIVLPRHSALENRMQDVQADVIRHEDTAPDGWFDARKFDFQLNQSVFRLSQWPCR